MRKLPIVLIHGMWGSPAHWSNFKSAFSAAGYHVLVVTLPKHNPGESPDNLSVMDYTNHVVSEVRRIGRCILVGHSMGGLIAQKAAELTGGLVEKVVMITSAAPGGIPCLTGEIMLRMLRPRYLSAMLSGRSYDIVADDAQSLMMNRFGKEVRPDSIFTQKESGRVTREISLGLIKVQRLDCPSLVVAGIFDKMTPLDVEKAIAKKHGSDFIRFPCGHLPLIEFCWPDVASRILQWINKTN